jgi:hypothetical protein
MPYGPDFGRREVVAMLADEGDAVRDCNAKLLQASPTVRQTMLRNSITN